MTNVLFLISVMSSGGAARVVSVLANHFAGRDDFAVSLLTHNRELGYRLDSRIKWTALFEPPELKSTLWNKVWRRFLYWPRLLGAITKNRPDTVVAVLRGMNWRGILACRILGIRVIATEHTNHAAEVGFWSTIERRLIYRLANQLVVLTEFDRQHYSRYLRAVSFIPNPLSFDVLSTPVERTRTLLAVGDLDRWYIKGFDTLIEVFSRVAADFPEWKLRIVGPGESGLQELRTRVCKGDLVDRVELSGFTRDIASHMRTSEIFVLTSRHEGFSLALLEAMSQGCACISFDCPAGPSDLISHNETGLLIRDQSLEGMESGLRTLMACETTRRRLGNAGVEASKDYLMENIQHAWVRAFRPDDKRHSRQTL